MPKKRTLSEPATKEYLGEFTDEVILPGVEAIVSPLERKIDKLTDVVTAGFADLKKSIQVLGGDVAELKEGKKEHEERIQVLERRAGAR